MLELLIRFPSFLFVPLNTLKTVNANVAPRPCRMRPRRFEIGSNRQSGRGIFDILHRIEKKYKIMGLHCKGYTRLFKKVSKPIKLKKKKCVTTSVYTLKDVVVSDIYYIFRTRSFNLFRTVCSHILKQGLKSLFLCECHGR